jgi:hypothetical protein
MLTRPPEGCKPESNADSPALRCIALLRHSLGVHLFNDAVRPLTKLRRDLRQDSWTLMLVTLSDESDVVDRL